MATTTHLFHLLAEALSSPPSTAKLTKVKDLTSDPAKLTLPLLLGSADLCAANCAATWQAAIPYFLGCLLSRHMGALLGGGG